MGTRHLTMVVVDGKLKVAQYGQWDGYPTGQGEDIVEFIKHNRNPIDLNCFKEQVRKLKWITKKKLNSLWEECGATPGELDSGWMRMEVSEEMKKRHPELSRDTGAEILLLISTGTITHLKNSHAFLKDGIYCEWAYLLNLDTEILEVYAGGTKPWRSIPFSLLTKRTMKDLEKAYRKENGD